MSKEYKNIPKGLGVMMPAQINYVRIFSQDGHSYCDLMQKDSDYRKIMQVYDHINERNMVVLLLKSEEGLILEAPITKENLTIITEKSKNETNDFFNRMKKLNILQEDDENRIFVNPRYVINGDGYYKKTCDLFKEDFETLF